MYTDGKRRDQENRSTYNFWVSCHINSHRNASPNMLLANLQLITLTDQNQNCIAHKLLLSGTASRMPLTWVKIKTQSTPPIFFSKDCFR